MSSSALHGCDSWVLYIQKKQFEDLYHVDTKEWVTVNMCDSDEEQTHDKVHMYRVRVNQSGSINREKKCGTTFWMDQSRSSYIV